MEEDEVKDEELINQAGNTFGSSASAIISIVVFALYGMVSQWNTGTNVIIALILALILFMEIQPRLRRFDFLRQDGGFGLSWILEKTILFATLVIVFLLVQMVTPRPSIYPTQHPAEAVVGIFVTLAVGFFIILTVYNDILIISMKGERFLGFGVSIAPVKKNK